MPRSRTEGGVASSLGTLSVLTSSARGNGGGNFVIEVRGLVVDPGLGHRVQGVTGVTADIGWGGPRSTALSNSFMMKV